MGTQLKVGIISYRRPTITHRRKQKQLNLLFALVKTDYIQIGINYINLLLIGCDGCEKIFCKSKDLNYR